MNCIAVKLFCGAMRKLLTTVSKTSPLTSRNNGIELVIVFVDAVAVEVCRVMTSVGADISGDVSVMRTVGEARDLFVLVGVTDAVVSCVCFDWVLVLLWCLCTVDDQEASVRLSVVPVSVA